MRHYLILIIALISSTSVLSEENTSLYDFRYWTAPDNTRIVIDTEEDAIFNVSKKNNYVIISFDDAEVLSGTFTNIFFKDERIKKVEIKRDKETIKLIYYISNNFTVKQFTLAPNIKYKHHRLVVDIIDSGKKPSIKSTEKTKKNTKTNSVAKILPIYKKIILVDAGHGGEDSGAIGKNKSKEKNVNLAIAKKLVTIINKNSDLKAILTRRGDYYIPLTKRITIAQKENATMFISIHADSVESSSAKGASIYLLSEDNLK